MRRFLRLVLALCGVVALWLASPSAVSAGLIAVGPDGGSPNDALADWGITFDATTGVVDWGTIYDGSPDDLIIYQGTHTTADGFEYDYAIEDYVATGGKVGPRYGGPDYDAEFLGIGVDMQRVVVAIVSGQRPDNGDTLYSPGDLYITTSTGVFGVELTGETFVLSGSGHTIPPPEPNENTTVGTVWLDPNWIAAEPPLSGGIYDSSPELKRAQLVDNTGTMVGTADVYFSRNDIGSSGDHSVFEVAIPFGVFGGTTITQIHWHPSCGNDILYTDTNIVTPEPASAVLLAMGMGVFGFGAVRRRWKSRDRQQAGC